MRIPVFPLVVLSENLVFFRRLTIESNDPSSSLTTACNGSIGAGPLAEKKVALELALRGVDNRWKLPSASKLPRDTLSDDRCENRPGRRELSRVVFA